MAAINCIAAVDIGRNRITMRGVAPKSVSLVCRGMCSKAGFGVDIIRLCRTPAWMVWRKAKRIEILVSAHYRGEVVIMGIKGR